MYWRIEWEFPDALLPTQLVEDAYDETLPLHEALDQYLEVQVVGIIIIIIIIKYCYYYYYYYEY